jgi:hypothetical protein
MILQFTQKIMLSFTRGIAYEVDIKENDETDTIGGNHNGRLREERHVT